MEWISFHTLSLLTLFEWITLMFISPQSVLRRENGFVEAIA